jgi:Tol biopolymer transport system component
MLLKRISLYQLLFILFFAFLTTACQKKTAVINRKIDKIVFLSNRDAVKREFDIFSMNRDGSNQTNLTRHIQGVRAFSNPCLSHDGKTALFVTLNQRQKILQALQIGDSTAVPLTPVNVDKPFQQFSPDDLTIIFMNDENGRSKIFKMNHDGSNPINLSQNEFENREPKFSPDGLKICFTTKRGNTTSIGIMNADGSGQELLTDDGGNDSNPSFSPDGSKITFCSDRLGNSDIFYLKISNKKINKIFTKKSHDVEPQFSPDGKHILFISNLRGLKYRDLLLVSLKSNKANNLTQSLDHFNQHPVFLPDGLSILFQSLKFADSEIYELGIDGQNLKNLSNHPGRDIAPSL